MIRIFDIKTKEVAISDNSDSKGLLLDYTDNRSILTFSNDFQDDNKNIEICNENNKKILTNSKRYIYYSSNTNFDNVIVIPKFKAIIDKNDGSENNFILDTREHMNISIFDNFSYLNDCFGELIPYRLRVWYNLPRLCDEIFNKNVYYSYSNFYKRLNSKIPNEKSYIDNISELLYYEKINSKSTLFEYMKEND